MSITKNEEKQRIRERIRALRQSLTPEDVLAAGTSVADHVRSCQQAVEAGTICLYASTGKEIPTDSLLQGFLEQGKRVVIPDWEGWKQGSGMRVVSIEGPDDLLHEGRVVPQPVLRDDSIVSPDEPDLYLVPGLAFDRSGNRLGMGGGFFDRLLALASSSATFLGLAYPFQIVSLLPSDTHDIRVDGVVTPAGVQLRGVDHKQEGLKYGS